MELLSAPLHTGSVPWQRLLLTVSLVTYWSSPTTSQVHIEFVPPHVAEGKNILLCVSNLPENLLSILWYKGESSLINTEIVRYVITTNVNKTGPAYSGRETIFPNGSLLIQNVNLNDTGFYTLQTQNAEGDRIDTSIQLHVYPAPDSGLPAGAIAGIVVGVVAGVALIAALAYFLYSRKTGRWLEFHEFQGPATKTANSSLPIDSSTEAVHS